MGRRLQSLGEIVRCGIKLVPYESNPGFPPAHCSGYATMSVRRFPHSETRTTGPRITTVWPRINLASFCVKPRMLGDFTRKRKKKKKSVHLNPMALFISPKASLKYLQFVQKHLKVSRTLHCKFNLKAHTWNNINIWSWEKKRKQQIFTLVPKSVSVWMANVTLPRLNEKPVFRT